MMAPLRHPCVNMSSRANKQIPRYYFSRPSRAYPVHDPLLPFALSIIPPNFPVNFNECKSWPPTTKNAIFRQFNAMSDTFWHRRCCSICSTPRFMIPSNFSLSTCHISHISQISHMGQFLQGGKNGRLMSFFFLKVEPPCDQT